MSEQELLAVFDHYGWNEPGYGERPFKCPAHDDRRPSASVNRTEGVWYCHGCGAGGSAAHIVMAVEDISYVEACQLIQTMTGGLPGDHRHTPGRSPKRKKKTGRWVPPSLRSRIEA